MTAPTTAPTTAPQPPAVRGFIRFLETGDSDGVFAPDVVCDFNFPYARAQKTTVDAVIALRRSEHPGPTQVRVERLDPTSSGWVLQFEERWERGGERWYARVLLRADVQDGRIVELAVYDTGDWDEAKQREMAVEERALGPDGSP
jgi:hypothetical protein